MQPWALAGLVSPAGDRANFEAFDTLTVRAGRRQPARSAVSRAMAKRSDERYQSMEEMLNALGHAETALARGDWRQWLRP